MLETEVLQPRLELNKDEPPSLQQQLQGIQTKEAGMQMNSFEQLLQQLKEAEVALGQINYSLQTLQVLTQVEHGLRQIQLEN